MNFRHLLCVLLSAAIVSSCRQSDEDLLPNNENSFQRQNLPSFIQFKTSDAAQDRNELCCQTSFTGWHKNNWANFETYTPDADSWRFIVNIESDKTSEAIQLAFNMEGIEPCLGTTLSIAPCELLEAMGKMDALRYSNIKVQMRIQSQNSAGQWITCGRDKSTALALTYRTTPKHQPVGE